MIENAWPVILIMYAALFLYLMLTRGGQNALNYVLGKCCKRNLNETIVANAPRPAPTKLELKTKRYVLPPVVEDEDDAACTICFVHMEEGERVGALPCNHCFHVDCLKEWLPRRNTCPLCQAPGVAAPKFEEQSEEQTTEEIRASFM